MRYTKRANGFTLVELLMALMVTSIILTAVATLAYAMGSADDAADDTIQKQAHLRYATLRLSELVRYCKLICVVNSDYVLIWRADINDDKLFNSNERVYIQKYGQGLRLLEFDEWGNPVSTMLIPQCRNIEFEADTAPMRTQRLTISFDLVEGGVSSRYQINTAMRSEAEHLLDGSGYIIFTDDDWL